MVSPVDCDRCDEEKEASHIQTIQKYKILQVLRAFGIPQRKHLYFISVSDPEVQNEGWTDTLIKDQTKIPFAIVI